MFFPSVSVAPSVYTDFVNGVKFDICEVDSSCYNMLSSKKSRFFLCVEDYFICNYKIAETFYQKTGEVRWDFFCATKQDCINKIDAFLDLDNKIKNNLEFVKNKPAFASSRGVLIDKLKNRMIDFYGVHP